MPSVKRGRVSVARSRQASAITCVSPPIHIATARRWITLAGAAHQSGDVPECPNTAAMATASPSGTSANGRIRLRARSNNP